MPAAIITIGASSAIKSKILADMTASPVGSLTRPSTPALRTLTGCQARNAPQVMGGFSREGRVSLPILWALCAHILRSPREWSASIGLLQRSFPTRSDGRLGCADADLVRPDLEAQQRVGTERIADCDVGRIAASRNEHPADPRHIVPRVEDAPAAAEIRLDPSGEIHWSIRRQDADVAEITGAIACRNVHAAAKCDGKVRIIAADAFPLVEGFKGRPSGTRVLVAERDMVVNKIADRLNSCPARRRMAKQVPSYLGQLVGLAIPAAQEKHQGFFG